MALSSYASPESHRKLPCWEFLLILLLLLAGQQRVEGVNIDAVSFTLQSPPFLSGNLSTNDILLEAERVHEGKINIPHSYVAYGDDIIAVTADGQVINVTPCMPVVIANLRPRGCVTRRECGHLISIRLNSENLLLVLDAYRGVFEVHPVTGVARHLYDSSTVINGRASLYLNDMVLMEDGTIVLSDASPTFDYDNEFWIRFEGRADGRLLGFNPVNGQVKEILASLAYPTGLEITSDKKALLVSEAGRARILRLELSQDRFFQRSYLNANLPGMPEHIRKSERDTYWVGLSYPRFQGEVSILDRYSERPASRDYLAVRRSKEQLKLMYTKRGLAVELDQSGRIVSSMHDPAALKVGEVMELTEFGGIVYVGTRAQPAVVRTVTSPAALTVDSVAQVVRGRCQLPDDRVPGFKRALEQRLSQRQGASGSALYDTLMSTSSVSSQIMHQPNINAAGATTSLQQPQTVADIKSIRKGLSQLAKALKKNAPAPAPPAGIQPMFNQQNYGQPMYNPNNYGPPSPNSRPPYQNPPNFRQTVPIHGSGYQPSSPYQQPPGNLQPPPPRYQQYNNGGIQPPQDPFIAPPAPITNMPSASHRPNSWANHGAPRPPPRQPFEAPQLNQAIPLHPRQHDPDPFHNPQGNSDPHVVHRVHNGHLVSHIMMTNEAAFMSREKEAIPTTTTTTTTTTTPQPPMPSQSKSALDQGGLGNLDGFMSFLQIPTSQNQKSESGTGTGTGDIPLPDLGPYGGAPSNPTNDFLQIFGMFTGKSDNQSTSGQESLPQARESSSVGISLPPAPDFAASATQKRQDANAQETANKGTAEIQNIPMFHPTEGADTLTRASNEAGPKRTVSVDAARASMLKFGLQQIQQLFKQVGPLTSSPPETVTAPTQPMSASNQDQVSKDNPQNNQGVSQGPTDNSPTRPTEQVSQTSTTHDVTSKQTMSPAVHDTTAGETYQTPTSFSAAASIHPNQPPNDVLDKGIQFPPRDGGQSNSNQRDGQTTATRPSMTSLYEALKAATLRPIQARTEQTSLPTPQNDATLKVNGHASVSLSQDADGPKGYIQIPQGPGKFILIPLTQATLMQALSGLQNTGSVPENLQAGTQDSSQHQTQPQVPRSETVQQASQSFNPNQNQQPQQQFQTNNPQQPPPTMQQNQNQQPTLFSTNENTPFTFNSQNNANQPVLNQPSPNNTPTGPNQGYTPQWQMSSYTHSNSAPTGQSFPAPSQTPSGGAQGNAFSTQWQASSPSINDNSFTPTAPDNTQHQQPNPSSNPSSYTTNQQFTSQSPPPPNAHVFANQHPTAQSASPTATNQQFTSQPTYPSGTSTFSNQQPTAQYGPPPNNANTNQRFTSQPTNSGNAAGFTNQQPTPQYGPTNGMNSQHFTSPPVFPTNTNSNTNQQVTTQNWPPTNTMGNTNQYFTSGPPSNTMNDAGQHYTSGPPVNTMNSNQHYSSGPPANTMNSNQQFTSQPTYPANTMTNSNQHFTSGPPPNTMSNGNQYFTNQNPNAQNSANQQFTSQPGPPPNAYAFTNQQSTGQYSSAPTNNPQFTSQQHSTAQYNPPTTNGNQHFTSQPGFPTSGSAFTSQNPTQQYNPSPGNTAQHFTSQPASSAGMGMTTNQQMATQFDSSGRTSSGTNQHFTSQSTSAGDANQHFTAPPSPPTSANSSMDANQNLDAPMPTS